MKATSSLKASLSGEKVFSFKKHELNNTSRTFLLFLFVVVAAVNEQQFAIMLMV